MTVSYDVAIVGGGPAGLAAALHAERAGLSSVVLEAKETPVDKACGEGIMPGGVASLAALGVHPEGRPFVGIRYRDAERLDLYAEGDFHGRPGLGVRRTELHRAMSERVDALGIPRVRRTVRRVDFLDDGICVEGLAARYLVGADGLHSTVRRLAQLDSPARTRRYGVRRHFAVGPWTDRVEVYWSTVGEAYVTPVDEGTIGVALLYRPPGRFDELLQHFPVLRSRLAGAVQLNEDRGAGPFGFRAVRRVSGRTLLVGDAAGYLDPLTGEGIQLGLATAAAAVTAIADGEPQRYEHEWGRVVRTYWWTTQALLWLTRPRVTHRPLINLLDRQPWLFDRALAILADSAL